MSDNKDNESNIKDEALLSNWEENCARDWEAETQKLDERLRSDDEAYRQKMWLSFQNSATSIAQLYKDRYQSSAEDRPTWAPFQNAASRTTRLYKDGLEAVTHLSDLGLAVGTHKRSRDVLAWARKKRRHIRREDLIAFLCGKPAPPPRHRPSGATLGRASIDRSSPRLSVGHNLEGVEESNEPDLTPFRDALALQGLNGAMSKVGFGSGGQSPNPHATTLASRGSPPHRDSEDFHYLILDEMSRRCGIRKRNSPETRIDSPSRKKTRFL